MAFLMVPRWTYMEQELHLLHDCMAHPDLLCHLDRVLPDHQYQVSVAYQPYTNTLNYSLHF